VPYNPDWDPDRRIK